MNSGRCGRNPGEVLKTMNLKRKLAIVAVPVVLAIGGAAAVHAATPNPAPPKAAQEAPDPAETTGTETSAAKETPEAPDAPGTAGVGHADPAGDVDHQATGEEK
jgi:hypothetical protein